MWHEDFRYCSDCYSLKQKGNFHENRYYLGEMGREVIFFIRTSTLSQFSFISGTLSLAKVKV